MIEESLAYASVGCLLCRSDLMLVGNHTPKTRQNGPLRYQPMHTFWGGRSYTDLALPSMQLDVEHEPHDAWVGEGGHHHQRRLDPVACGEGDHSKQDGWNYENSHGHHALHLLCCGCEERAFRSAFRVRWEQYALALLPSK